MELTAGPSPALAETTPRSSVGSCAGPTATWSTAGSPSCSPRPAAESGADGVALVAVGGYGRAELSLQSDIDVLLLHGGRSDIGTLADGALVPDLGRGPEARPRRAHDPRGARARRPTTSTPPPRCSRSATSPATRTSPTSWRGRALEQWQQAVQALAGRPVDAACAARHETAGEVAFLLEPDLKEGRGGLRDVHALRWAEAARSLLWEGDDPRARRRPTGPLLSARVELHRRTEPPGRPAAARGAGRGGRRARRRSRPTTSCASRRRRPHDRLAQRRRLAAHRRVAERARSGSRSRRRQGRSAPGLVLRDGEVHLTADADRSATTRRSCCGPPRRPPPAAPASTGRRSTAWPRRPRRCPSRGPSRCAPRSSTCCSPGHRAIPVIEALDQLGLWEQVLPEWAAVRSKPQRNAYHRFTVDRHLIETAANAAALVARTDRPDLLVLGALLHDIGKGYPGDHTEVGIELLDTIGPAHGASRRTTWPCSQAMVRHHLLLPDVATRRDLDDPATIAGGGRGGRRPAHARPPRRPHRGRQPRHRPGGLGPVEGGPGARPRAPHRPRARRRLARGGPRGLPDRGAPRAARRRASRCSGARATGSRSSPRDRPGLFSRVTGVLALTASASSTPRSPASTAWPSRSCASSRASARRSPGTRSSPTSRRALEGRLALQARLAERARVYGGRARPAPIQEPPRVVRRQRGLARAPRWWRSTPPTRSACSTGSPGPCRSSTSTSCRPRSRRSATGWSTPSTCAARPAAKVEDPAMLVEIERALLHELAG